MQNKIVAGGYYMTESGNVVGPMRANNEPAHGPWGFISDTGRWYTDDGRAFVHGFCEADLLWRVNQDGSRYDPRENNA